MRLCCGLLQPEANLPVDTRVAVLQGQPDTYRGPKLGRLSYASTHPLLMQAPVSAASKQAYTCNQYTDVVRASSTDREKKDVTRQCASTWLHAGLHDTLIHATACLEHMGADESSLAALWPEEAIGQLLFVLAHDASVKVWPLR